MNFPPFSREAVAEVFKDWKMKSKLLFEDYEGFVDKFKPKKTTDECYTPPIVYDAVLEYVRANHPLDEHVEILRPFYPNGDYQAVDYKENQIVVDNPPFSILAHIVRFYMQRGIKFFLFAPAMTLFTTLQSVTKIVTGSDIAYENGAKVSTSFLTNMWGDGAIIVDGVFGCKLTALTEKPKANLRRLKYPKNLVSAALIGKCVRRGISFTFPANEIMKSTNSAVFGGGYLISDNCAKVWAQAQEQEQAQAQEIPLTSKDIILLEKLNNL